jgi:hypothetical protein
MDTDESRSNALLVTSGSRFRRALARVLILAVCAAVLGACSLVRLGYTQLDTLAVWTADDYFELEPEQRQQFARRFDRLHQWHRYEQLPDYAAFLSELQGRLQRGPTREDFLWLSEGVMARYRTLVRRGAEDAAAVLMSVTPTQLETLKQRWEQDNRRFVREYRLDRGVEEQQRAHARRVASRVRDWVGHLDDAQERQILAWARTGPPIHGLRHQDRLRRQREFLALMEERSDPGKFAARLEHWLANWEAGRDPEYARQFREWLERQADLYAAVYGMLLPQQRGAVADRLDGYISDFSRLARRPEVQPTAAR